VTIGENRGRECTIGKKDRQTNKLSLLSQETVLKMKFDFKIAPKVTINIPVHTKRMQNVEYKGREQKSILFNIFPVM